MARIWIATQDENVESIFDDLPVAIPVQIWASSSGEASAEGIVKKRVRLAVIDDDLEDIEGIVLLERLRKDAPMLPVIFLTAHHSEELERRVRGLGALFYAAKPFSAKLLAKLVVSALDHETTKHSRVAVGAVRRADVK